MVDDPNGLPGRSEGSLVRRERKGNLDLNPSRMPSLSRRSLIAGVTGVAGSSSTESSLIEPYRLDLGARLPKEERARQRRRSFMDVEEKPALTMFRGDVARTGWQPGP